jgi:hypothetical protein
MLADLIDKLIDLWVELPVSSVKTRTLPPSFTAKSTKTTSSAPLKLMPRRGEYS